MSDDELDAGNEGDEVESHEGGEAAPDQAKAEVDPWEGLDPKLKAGYAEMVRRGENAKIAPEKIFGWAEQGFKAAHAQPVQPNPQAQAAAKVDSRDPDDPLTWGEMQSMERERQIEAAADQIGLRNGSALRRSFVAGMKDYVAGGAVLDQARDLWLSEFRGSVEAELAQRKTPDTVNRFKAAAKARGRTETEQTTEDPVRGTIRAPSAPADDLESRVNDMFSADAQKRMAQKYADATV